MAYANSRDADQPAHLHTLISIFVGGGLDSILFICFISRISRLASD